MKILLVKPKARLAAVLGLQGFSLLEPLELAESRLAIAREFAAVLALELGYFAVRRAQLLLGAVEFSAQELGGQARLLVAGFEACRNEGAG